MIVTYDEFGGQWDHVVPARPGRNPGPARPVGPRHADPGADPSRRTCSGNFVVDHTQYDTTSILATIEARYGLAPLSSRDAAVNDLFDVFRAKGRTERTGTTREEEMDRPRRAWLRRRGRFVRSSRHRRAEAAVSETSRKGAACRTSV